MTHQIIPPVSAITLSQLLVTKLCHDVANPIGAINNGMELLAEDASMHDAAMELISSSAQSAGARIQFYRYIFGMLKGEGIVDMRDKKALIDGFYTGSKISVVWKSCPETMTQADCQVLCNLICVAGSCLVRGGELAITVQQTPDGNAELMRIDANGTHLKLDTDIHKALLHHKKFTPNAKSAQSYYTALLAEELAATLTLEMDEEAYHFQFQATA